MARDVGTAAIGDGALVVVPLDEIINWLLAVILFPLWMAAGVSDYFCHRASFIETTSGLKESVSHLVMASLMGTGVLLLLIFDLNLLTLILMALLFVAHEVVTQLDLRTAHHVRDVGTVEQQIHAYLEAIPFAGVLLLGVAVVAGERWDITFAVRDPLYWHVVIAVLSTMTVFGALPYWEEFWRCLRQAWRPGMSLQELWRLNAVVTAGKRE